MRVVEEAVADGIGEGGIVEVRVPLRDRQLAGDDGGAGAGAILEDFEEVLAVRGVERREGEVVEDQDVDARQPREPAGVGAVSAGEHELVEEPRRPPVERTGAVATGLVGERAGEEGLARAGGAGDEDVLVFGDPATGRELADLGAIEPAAGRVVEVFQGGLRQTQLGLLSARRGSLPTSSKLPVRISRMPSRLRSDRNSAGMRVSSVMASHASSIRARTSPSSPSAVRRPAPA